MRCHIPVHRGISESPYRTMASALDIAQRPGTTNELTDAHRQLLAAAGHDEMDIE